MSDNPWLPWTKAQADALRALNAPLESALRNQQEAAAALATMAEQLTAMAELLGRTASQQAELARAVQSAMRPYQDYLAWLDGRR